MQSSSLATRRRLLLSVPRTWMPPSTARCPTRSASVFVPRVGKAGPQRVPFPCFVRSSALALCPRSAVNGREPPGGVAGPSPCWGCSMPRRRGPTSATAPGAGSGQARRPLCSNFAAAASHVPNGCREQGPWCRGSPPKFDDIWGGFRVATEPPPPPQFFPKFGGLSSCSSQLLRVNQVRLRCPFSN